MTKQLYIPLLLLLAFTGAAAQPRLKVPEIYIGGQAGVLASMVHFSPSVKQSALQPHWGANAGFVFRYNGHKFCGLQAELNYMQRGWREPATAQRTELSRRADYLEIPFMAHIYFGKRYRGYINLGPQIGVLIYDSKTPVTTDAYQHQADLQRFDYGATAGLGFYARSVAGTWQLEARFNYSLSTIFPSSPTDYFANSNNMNLSVNFAYLWELKPKNAGKTANNAKKR